jgi:hypothetical protein
MMALGDWRKFDSSMRIAPAFLLLALLLSASCTKDSDLIPDNDAPYYGEVADVVIRNYINRCFIDLIGREPFDTEMEAWLITLKAGGLQTDVRETMLVTLQSDTTFLEGDGSYKNAYYNRLYEAKKARFVEAASNDEVNEVRGPIASGILGDSLMGNWEGVAARRQQLEKLDALMASELEYRDGLITINEVCARMIDNAVYDQIHMNTFNFVNASFNDLFFRFPTGVEFEQGYNMIEYNQSGVVLGRSGQNKSEYVGILTEVDAFYEGLVIWTYQVLLARNPSTLETNHHMTDLVQDGDFQKLQREVMKGDEYAQFNIQ